MKAFCFFIILFFNVFLIMASPARTSPAPTYNTYGGSIYFKNTSSHNQYWEIDLIDNPQGGFYFDRICLEKNDVIRHDHKFFVLIADDSKFDKTSVDPNKYFKAIRIYDMDTGTLLKEFHAGDKIFVLISENMEHGVWNIDITDAFLTGGN
jgi:hypothetical protein